MRAFDGPARTLTGMLSAFLAAGFIVVSLAAVMPAISRAGDDHSAAPAQTGKTDVSPGTPAQGAPNASPAAPPQTGSTGSSAAPAPSGSATGAAPPAESKGADESYSTAPDFTAQGVDDKTYTLKDLLAKGPVLLDFWTTWCKPCMMEIPHLQKIWEAHREQGFTLLGVASDDPRSASKIKPMVQSKGFKFPNVFDPDRGVNNLFNVRNYPTSILIAPDGRIVVLALGYHPGDEKEMEARIVSLLPPAKGSAGSAPSGTTTPGGSDASGQTGGSH